MSRDAYEVLKADAQLISQQCIRPPTDEEAWDEGRCRTGLVAGAVQSGKTSAMLALSALLLDQGLDILVVLAGTRVALWLQTYTRFLAQLDCSTPENASERASARLLVPNPYGLLRGEQRASPKQYMANAASHIGAAIKKTRPVILVVPKQADHLLEVSRALESQLPTAADNAARKLHMVVIDDEADDSSVLDASDSRVIPRRIEMLWTGKRRTSTFHERLYATYIAFTATPQANLLQIEHNPLAPRDFRVSLRVPYKTGTTSPRCPTYFEPAGIKRFYIGGQFFYQELRGSVGAPCVTLPFPSWSTGTPASHAQRVRHASDELLQQGLISYLVSAAVRRIDDRKRGCYSHQELATIGRSLDPSRLPSPHTMLVHPSSEQALHLEEARRLVVFSRNLHPDSAAAPSALQPNELALSVKGLRQQLRDAPEKWRACLSSFRDTTEALAMFPGASELGVPAAGEWPVVRATIEEDILPFVRLKIINSDPNSDDRPQFETTSCDDVLTPPADLLTIFVSGNVMSRGITLEGLTTSVFFRPAGEPAADTQMQMQRWFGYRGSYAHLCRLFCFDDQLENFVLYHENDQAMRKEMIAAMDRNEFVARPHVVLCGPRSLATAKVPTTRLPLHPGPNPSVKILETGPLADHNANVLASILENDTWAKIETGNTLRGIISEKLIDLLELATILESLRYSFHSPPTLLDERFTRWRSLEDSLGLLETERPLFRPPAPGSDGQAAVEPSGCPFSIAAYLRLWAAALKRSACEGLFASDGQGIPWSLAQPLLKAPRFFVGVRFGDEGLSSHPRLSARGVCAMKRAQERGAPQKVRTLWGTRNPSANYYGDPLFDYHHSGYPPPPLLGSGQFWRPRHHPGLLLFHVIRPEHGGDDAVTFGLSLPHGGPEQFVAVPLARAASV